MVITVTFHAFKWIHASCLGYLSIANYKRLQKLNAGHLHVAICVIITYIDLSILLQQQLLHNKEVLDRIRGQTVY